MNAKIILEGEGSENFFPGNKDLITRKRHSTSPIARRRSATLSRRKDIPVRKDYSDAKNLLDGEARHSGKIPKKTNDYSRLQKINRKIERSVY